MEFAIIRISFYVAVMVLVTLCALPMPMVCVARASMSAATW